MALDGPAVYAFIEAILSRISYQEKHFRSSEFRSELHQLKESLSMIQSRLNDASAKEVNDKPVELLLKDLQHLCYDLDDVLDGVEMIRESKSFTSKVVQKFKNSVTLNKVHLQEKLDYMNKRLRDLEDDPLRFTMKKVKPEKPIRIRETTVSLPDFEVVGRQVEKQRLLKKLLLDDPSGENFSIVPIVGIGGVGKTALATVLYSDTQVKDHFELRAWVCVSDEFDVFKISKTIFQSLTHVDMGFQDLHEFQMGLEYKFKGKRFLLVLDDVWNEDYNSWDELVRPFHVGAPGSKIIVTTRKEHLLKKLGFNHIDHLKSLSHEDALSLLALHALGVDNFDSNPTLRPQGEAIVKICGGLPLALKAIGRLLRTKTGGEAWDDVLNSQKADVISTLKLSYNDLTSHLKVLFAYCSLFPKGFLFDKENLVLLWLAEGYLDHAPADELNDSPERLGHDYFDTLLSRSFFQHAPYHESLFVMHDLMNDLARSVAAGRFLLFDKQMSMVDTAFSMYRHISFAREKHVGYKQFEAFKRADSLRTLLAVSVEADDSRNFFYLPNKILDDLLPHLPLLRVLYLSNCNICEVPEFIGRLKHLRYLNLSQTKIKELPESVGNLYYLQTLVVFGCRGLTKLPKSFLKLKKLRHFDMRDTPLLENMPLGISELKSLRTLPKIIVGGDNGFAISNLKGLKNLCGELFIEELQKVQSPVHAREAELPFKRLTKLVLKWGNVFDSVERGKLEREVLNELKPYHDTLKELAIVSYGGLEFPNWVGNPSFRLLTDVSIIDCRNCTSLPPLGSLLLLKKLLIKGMHEIKAIGSQFGGAVVIAFPTLEILVFENMLGWEYWSNKGTTSSDTAFPCLRELQIKNCPNLIYVSLEAMPSLRVLQIGGCGHGVLRSLVQVATSITKLEIESILGLTDEVWRGVIEYLGAVEEVSISVCNEIIYLWESETEAGMVLVNLRKLEVFRCSNLVSLGEKEEDNYGPGLLTSLRNLEIWFCESMERCNCPYEIERLTIGSCSSLTHVSFPTGGQKLKSLSLYGCQKLIERINNANMQMLEFVEIRSWSNLKSIIELGICIHLTFLKIQDCQSLESFPELLLPQLTHLTIGDCQSLVSFDLQLLKCTSLKNLEITNCPSIDASFPRGVWPPMLCSLEIGGLKKPISEWGPQNFPTSLVCLKLLGEHVNSFIKLSHLLPSSLTELHIQEFDELESLSMGLEHLTSLQHLGIFNCPKMKILPKTLLPSLLILEIFDCPNLKRRCNGRGSHYWPLISHIPCIDIQDGYSFIK